jgi:hypothetical protein
MTRNNVWSVTKKEGERHRLDRLLQLLTTGQKRRPSRWGEYLDVSRHALARILQDDLKADKGTYPERVLKGLFVLLMTWISRDFRNMGPGVARSPLS